MRSEGGAVAAFGPGPIEVAERLEASDISGAQAALQASARALLLLPVDQRDLAGLIRAKRNFAAVRAFVLVKGVQGHHEDRTGCSSH